MIFSENWFPLFGIMLYTTRLARQIQSHGGLVAERGLRMPSLDHSYDTAPSRTTEKPSPVMTEISSLRLKCFCQASPRSAIPSFLNAGFGRLRARFSHAVT